MLNMLDTQDKLKNFSEQQLIQEMQRPSGSAPQFMVLGEIERRKRMRADAQRQEGLMQPTVAQEAVSAAGVPQQGIAQVAQSLAPQTDMTQNTGVPNVQVAGLPGQPNQPQRMANGGILRLAPGGGLSGGTLSAIASLKVNRPDIYEEYKDDPEALAMVAEYFNFPATDSERTGLESIEAPYVDPYGPQGLAQRTAAAEVGNQARLASDAAKQAVTFTQGSGIGSGRQGAPLDAEARRRIAEEDMAMAVPVPRGDFRTFPVEMPLTRDEKILADAQAAIKRYSTGAGRDAEGNLLPVAPDSDLTRAIEQRKRDEADEFFFNAGMFDRTAPENVARQPRGSSNLVGRDYTPTSSELSAQLADADLPDLRQSQTDTSYRDVLERFRGGSYPNIFDVRDERNIDLAQEQAQAAFNRRKAAGDFNFDSASSATSGRPRAQGIASFGVFDPIVDRFKEIRSEDAARNAAAAEGDLDAFLDVGSENDPAFLGSAMEALSNPVERFNSEMAARQAAGERNYANAVQGVEALNQRIADAKADGNEILAQQLTTARDQLGGTLRNQERAKDVAEGILTIPTAINKAFQESSLGVGLRGPDATAQTLTELEAEQKTAKEAEATRERRVAELLGGATPTVMDAAEDAQEEFSQRPDTQDVKPAAQQKKIAAAIKTVTDPAAMPPAIKPDTGGTSTGKKSGIAAEKSKMDQDKWLALAQAGFVLMSTGDFGKAGQAGIAALRQSKQDEMAERKLDAELMLREAQLAKANRAPAAKAIPAAYLTDLRKAKEDIQSKLASLRPPVPAGKFYGDAQDPDAVARKRLQDELEVVNAQINQMYSQYNLGTSVTDRRTKV